MRLWTSLLTSLSLACLGCQGPEESGSPEQTARPGVEEPLMIDVMLDMDILYSELSPQQKEGWPANGSEARAQAEALEAFLEQLESMEEVRAYGPGLLEFLEQTQAAAADLSHTLAGGSLKRADEAFLRVKGGCAACHERYRDG